MRRGEAASGRKAGGGGAKERRNRCAGEHGHEKYGNVDEEPKMLPTQGRSPPAATPPTLPLPPPRRLLLCVARCAQQGHYTGIAQVSHEYHMRIMGHQVGIERVSCWFHVYLSMVYILIEKVLWRFEHRVAPRLF